MTAPVSRDAVLSALKARPPRSLLAYADRLLLACVADPLDEKAQLLSRATGLLDHARALADGGTLFEDLTTMLVIAGLFVEEGAPVAEDMRVFLAPFCMASRVTVDARAEPERSAFLHWQQRAQLGKSFTVGRAPVDDLVAVYHWTHVVFYETHYGARAAMSAVEARAALINARAHLSRLEEPNADVVAEVLLANECVRPADAALRDALRASLGAMQQPDGTLDMPDDAEPDARHHALVVTALALAIAGDD